MSRGVTEQTRAICSEYTAAIGRGAHDGATVERLAVIYDVQRPAIWKALRSGGALPPYQPHREGGKGRPKGGGKPGYTEARRYKRQDSGTRLADVPEPVPSRDPCPRCGARGDYPCGHSKAPLSMGL
jgi:hypothetical protein